MLAFSSKCRFAENSLTNLSNDTVRERKTHSLVRLLATYGHTKVTMMRGHKTRRSGSDLFLVWTGRKMFVLMLRFSFISFPQPHSCQIFKHDSTLLCCDHSIGKRLPLQKKNGCMWYVTTKHVSVLDTKSPIFPSENDILFCTWIISVFLYLKLTSHMWKILIGFQVNEIEVVMENPSHCHPSPMSQFWCDFRQKRKKNF